MCTQLKQIGDHICTSASTSLALVLTKVPVVDSGNSEPEYTGTLVTVYCVPDDTSSVWSRKGDQTSSSISSSTHQCTQGKPDEY